MIDGDDLTGLLNEVRAGQRRAVARAITLVESTKPDHLETKARFLDGLLAHGADREPSVSPTVRLGISGTPGVGKSTLIESIGLKLIAEGHRVAVLAVDPTSSISRGSILGDKTRMPRLTAAPEAFIRPSPSGQAIGGITASTGAAIMVCEAAGFDVLLIETMGVGQSEHAVADVTDLFLLLHSPGGGDELQGIKRGVMELADRVAVTKADGDLLPAAGRARTELLSALHLMRPKPGRGPTPVDLCSAATGEGIDDLLVGLFEQHAAIRADGQLAELRSDQLIEQLWAAFDHALRRRTGDSPAFDSAVRKATAAVRAGDRSPLAAALELVRTASNPSREINAITLAVSDMARSVRFYGDLGFPLLYGGPDTEFTSLAHGSNAVNLQLAGADSAVSPWGRVILYVPDPDAVYERAQVRGLAPSTSPTDAPWGERYFHISDPDGHELSFARPLH